MGVVDGNAPASDHDWETVTMGGDETIKRWIDGQMDGKGCCIVLIGANTAGRKWINYEIIKAWNDGKGVLGVYIHSLKNKDGYQTTKGGNPFVGIVIGKDSVQMATVVKAYDPPYATSTEAYNYIWRNMAAWIEAAVKIRDEYRASST
jgi:hypothetical protein